MVRLAGILASLALLTALAAIRQDPFDRRAVANTHGSRQHSMSGVPQGHLRHLFADRHGSYDRACAGDGDGFAAREALRLLEEALPTHQDDPEVLTRLGYLYQLRGDVERTTSFYDRALRMDPARAVVAANLRVFYIRQGRLTRALALRRDTFDRNPQLTELGVNLGRASCASGDFAGALQVVRRALEHNPDAGAARQLLPAVTERNCTRQ